MKLNLGCGQDYIKGYINVDNNKKVKADKYIDLNKIPYPFDDNSISEIRCNQIIEHLNISLIDFFKECFRIMRNNSNLHIEIPNAFFWKWRLQFLFGKCDGSYWSPHHTKLLHPDEIEFIVRILGFSVTKYKFGLKFLPRSLSEKNLVYDLKKRGSE